MWVDLGLIMAILGRFWFCFQQNTLIVNQFYQIAKFEENWFTIDAPMTGEVQTREQSVFTARSKRREQRRKRETKTSKMVDDWAHFTLLAQKRCYYDEIPP